MQGVLVVSGEKDEHQVSKQMLKFAQTIPVSWLLPPLSQVENLSHTRKTLTVQSV